MIQYSIWRVTSGLHTMNQVIVGALLGSSVGLLAFTNENNIMKYIKIQKVPLTLRLSILLFGAIVLYYREVKQWNLKN